MFLALTLGALLTEASFSYPNSLYRRIGHPVTWIGRLITLLDRRLNRAHGVTADRFAGLVALILIVGIPVLFTLIGQNLLRLLLPAPVQLLIEVLIASMFIAQRSLYDHVHAVFAGLIRTGLAGGRQAVSQIVGRDPEALDTSGVVRAAIESLSENFSDGIVAPVFWLTIFGLPGLVAYKAINTADSMIGHITPRHCDFGRAAALLDDAVNVPASRLTALFIILAALFSGRSAGAAIRTVWLDAGRHRSPNAGWPESAMAGALTLRLAGPRRYAGVLVPDSWMGSGREEATPDDLTAALSLFRLGCLIQGACLFCLLIGLPA